MPWTVQVERLPDHNAVSTAPSWDDVAEVDTDKQKGGLALVAFAQYYAQQRIRLVDLGENDPGNQLIAILKWHQW